MEDILNTEDLAPQLARKRLRIGAILIDYAIYIGFFVFMGMMFGERYVTDDGTSGFRVTGIPALICFSFWFIVFPICEGATGQTIGKMIFGIEVRSERNSRANFGQSLVRHIFDFVDAFFLGLVGILVASNNPRKQRVGDLVAKTIVVNK